MRAAVETLILYLADHPNEARTLIVESSALTTKLANVRRSIIASHCKSVERALTNISGSLPRLHPKVVASCWVGAVHESVYQWLQTPKEQRTTPEALAQEISHFNFPGIGVERVST